MAKPSLVQLQRLVGNPHAYAVQQDNGTYTPVREQLSPDVLERHLAQQVTVGTYIGHVADGVTVARTLVFDVDSGGDEALEQVSAIRDTLSTEFDVPAACMGIEFSGKKGYHLWLPLQEPRPNVELRRLGRAALALAGVQCEVYPKQDTVRDLGNLVKLPGGVHRVSGKPNDFIDRMPMPLPEHKWAEMLSHLPVEEVSSRRKVSDYRFPCVAYILDEGVQEGSRNNQLFHAATMLRRAGLTDEYVELVVRRTNERGDPLDEQELETLLESSKLSGPICGTLPEDRTCGDLCVLERTKGLHTRPHALRHGAEGEAVVVTVKERDQINGVWTVKLEHDDISDAKAVLK